MAQQHDRSGVIKFCRQVIRANPTLSDDDLYQQIDSVWKSGYLAGRRAMLRESLVAKGVSTLAKMRRETRYAMTAQTNRKEKTN